MMKYRKKFRAYNKIDKFWVNNYDFAITFNGDIIYNLQFHEWGEYLSSDQLDIIIQESAGVTDVNGQDLYEGDILEEVYGNELPRYLCKRGETFVGNKLALFSIITGIVSNECYDFYGGLYLDDKAIIGNIFDNLEMVPLNLEL